jgi:hypothetical protein
VAWVVKTRISLEKWPKSFNDFFARFLESKHLRQMFYAYKQSFFAPP